MPENVIKSTCMTVVNKNVTTIHTRKKQDKNKLGIFLENVEKVIFGLQVPNDVKVSPAFDR